MSYQPAPFNQFPVRSADRVGVNPKSASKTPNARQFLLRFQLCRGHQKDDLLAQLISDGDFTFPVDTKIHFGARFVRSSS